MPYKSERKRLVRWRKNSRAYYKQHAEELKAKRRARYRAKVLGKAAA